MWGFRKFERCTFLEYKTRLNYWAANKRVKRASCTQSDMVFPWDPFAIIVCFLHIKIKRCNEHDRSYFPELEVLKTCHQIYSIEIRYSVGFEVLTAAVMKSCIFWDIAPCSPLDVNRRFVRYLLHATFFLGLFFDPKDENYIFFCNGCWHSIDYTA
jgi:hypothetical protein